MQEIASTERKCPNCGAPLPVQMSNYIDDEIIECEYCHSKFKLNIRPSLLYKVSCCQVRLEKRYGPVSVRLWNL